jgi:hypothetical protein
MAWGGIVVPSSTPPAVVVKLNRERNACLADPAARANMVQNAAIPNGGTPDPFRS